VSEVTASTPPDPLVTLSLQADDFTLFGLSPGFAVARETLDARWKQLQRHVHPDRFAAQGAAAQRVSMQWSVRLNEAYQRLKDPLKRAAYWCELRGAPVQADSNTAMPAAFLMQQMAWREALEDARTEPELNALLADTRQARSGLLATLEHLIDAQGDARAAVAEVRALMFVERFEEEVHQRLERL
jgi:molecular chaperone HscB